MSEVGDLSNKIQQTIGIPNLGNSSHPIMNPPDDWSKKLMHSLWNAVEKVLDLLKESQTLEDTKLFPIDSPFLDMSNVGKTTIYHPPVITI